MNYHLLTADQMLTMVTQRAIPPSKSIQVLTTGPLRCPILFSPQRGSDNTLPIVTAKLSSEIPEGWCTELRAIALALPEVGWTARLPSYATDAFYTVRVCVPTSKGDTPLYRVMMTLIHELEERDMIVKEDSKWWY